MCDDTAHNWSPRYPFTSWADAPEIEQGAPCDCGKVTYAGEPGAVAAFVARTDGLEDMWGRS